MICLILAISENNVIGINGGLPWKLPKDLKRFKELTYGHTVVMGRRTFQSTGILPGRKNIVLSSTLSSYPDIQVCDTFPKVSYEGDLFVIGGVEIYNAFLPLADIVYLTRVHDIFQGDVFYNPDLSNFKLVNSEFIKADGKHTADFTFETYRRLT